VLLIGINGFGVLSVNGRNLLPRPPAKISAFIIELIYLCFLTYVITYQNISNAAIPKKYPTITIVIPHPHEPKIV